jgi:LacI family transcriptional regulator
MMRVTVNDIARHANVSQTTVSRVLNNYPQVKESTRKKVLAAIEELNFTPDTVARSMVTKKTNTIGLILGDISNPFFAESSKIMIEKAQNLGYDVIISNTNHDDANLDNAIQTLLNKRVDGLLISSVYKNYKRIEELYDSGMPVVLFTNKTDDNEKGARLAVNHLVQLGHKKIAFASGPFKYSAIYDRYIGYQSELKKHGLELQEELIYNHEATYDGIYYFADNLLSMKEAPTAFFAASDQIALTIMDAAANNNYDVPNDLSIIGFDNMNISSNQYIGLTTISQQKEKMSLIALEKLILLIEKGDVVSTPIQVKLDPELIVRKTSSTASSNK